MCMTLITRACGFGETRADTEFTSSWPAAGKIVLTWNVERVVFDPVLDFGAGAAGCATVVVVVVAAGAGVESSAKLWPVAIAATRAASPSRPATLIPERRRPESRRRHRTGRR